MNEDKFKAAIDGAIHYDYHGINLTIAGVKHPTPHFHFLSGDINFATYGGKWASKRFNNGDFDYYLVIELRNNHEDSGVDSGPMYDVSIGVVSPEAAGEKNVKDAFESCGLPDELAENAYIQVEALHDYGIYAHVWHVEGNNWRKLMAEAHRQALFVNAFFGLYMDERRNAIGNNGWDFVRGHIGFGHAA